MSAAHARVGASAGAVVTDEDGRVLIVKPTYKPAWNLPGGRIDEGELPRAACARELREELGVEPAVGPLLVSAWVTVPGRGSHVYYVFDGGTLTGAQQESMVLQSEELAEHRFVAPREIGPELIPAPMSVAWEAALAAREDGQQRYVEVTAG
ncbi:NUDIX domain-containing protein [Streptomyces sp. NPDC057743]|uniref:NUDIX domain-containing protein n=1 Tax=Streptomyces sp. NPDC057743 TaxID=3346236 RepID=UPI0036BF6488